jgi:hypothetical protein
LIWTFTALNSLQPVSSIKVTVTPLILCDWQVKRPDTVKAYVAVHMVLSTV